MLSVMRSHHISIGSSLELSNCILGTKIPSVAPPTQGTWRSNDYVNALRLVDAWLLFSME